MHSDVGFVRLKGVVGCGWWSDGAEDVGECCVVICDISWKYGLIILLQFEEVMMCFWSNCVVVVWCCWWV